jgi:hypothetical protein
MKRSNFNVWGTSWLLTRILDELGSYISRGTWYPDRFFRFSSALPCKFRDSRSITQLTRSSRSIPMYLSCHPTTRCYLLRALRQPYNKPEETSKCLQTMTLRLLVALLLYAQASSDVTVMFWTNFLGLYLLFIHAEHKFSTLLMPTLSG